MTNPYNKMKIRTKLIMLNLAIVLLFTVVSLMAFSYGLSVYDGLLYDSAVKSLEQSTQVIENELIKMEAYTYNLVSDKDFQKRMKDIKEADNSFAAMTQAEALLDKLLIYASSEKFISVIYFFDVDDFTYLDGINPVSMDEKVKKDVIKTALAEEGDYIIYQNDASKGYIIGARQMRYTENLSLEHLGVVAFRLELDEVVERYLASSDYKESNLVIASDSMMIYDSAAVSMIDVEEMDGERGHRILNLDDKRYFAAYFVSEYSGWKYINLIPFDQVFESTELVRNTILTVFAILVVCVIYIGVATANNIIKPLQTLTARMKKVETGDFGPSSEPFDYGERDDEVGRLYKDFEIMIQRIDTLIEEDYKKQLVIKDTSLKALQAQINPHFLYNTLESINWLAKSRREKEISSMAESLGKLLRNAVDDKEMLITIGQELNLLEAYITIQKYRFEERLIFTNKIGRQYYSYKIPKLTLQPIVENAIKHGLENMLEPCTISLEAEVIDDTMRLVVSDNGPGMDDDRVMALNEGVSLSSSSGSGIGMKNIRQRLAMVYGPGCELVVESELNAGTRIILNIPMDRLNEGGAIDV